MKLLNTIGVIHGRFQPFHIGHLDYLMEAKSKCSFLYIGIANPDPSLTAYNDKGPHRALEKSNPFTYYERQLMIRELMRSLGISSNEYDFVPFPINRPELIQYYVPKDSAFFITIYDEWGKEKKRILEGLGLNVVVLEEGGTNLKKATGTEIRKLIAEGKSWREFIPLSVYECIKKINSKKIYE